VAPDGRVEKPCAAPRWAAFTGSATLLPRSLATLRFVWPAPLLSWRRNQGMQCALLTDDSQSTTRLGMSKKPLQLGQPASIPASPEEAVLDRVPNPHPDSDYVARFTFPEFTSICPVTGQPDFATLVIDYAPRGFLVESKSLKLYLNSFRNHGAFHEDCTVAIGKKLVALLKPKWLRIGGYFHPRGGMPIDVFWQAGKLPSGVWVPDQGVPTYRAR
jgi:7-cyano-7-deazaguanine reductase